MNGLCPGKGVPAGLPAGGNAVEPAERDEKQSLLAAIAIAASTAIIADVANRRVLDCIAVLDLVGDPIVELFGREIRVCFVSADSLRECAHLWREHDMRGLTGELFLRVVVQIARLDFGGVNMETYPPGAVIVFNFELRGLFFFLGLFEVKRANRAMIGIKVLDRRGGRGQFEIFLKGIKPRNREPGAEG